MKSRPAGVEFAIASPATPGAIATFDIHGPDLGDWLESFCQPVPPAGRLAVADLGGLDRGLVMRLSADRAQLMPHGGIRLVQRIAERLVELGAAEVDRMDPLDAYPEASTHFEADLLATLCEAQSPAAIDLLLLQAKRWEAVAEGQAAFPQPNWCDPLRHLLRPPTLAVRGRPNVGKSSLFNLLAGRDAALASDRPGTTRDFVAALVDLPTPLGALRVRWLDTPGIRSGADPLERRAVQLCAQAIEAADLQLLLRDPTGGHLDGGAAPAVRAVNKADLLDAAGRQAAQATGELLLSVLEGAGMAELGDAILQALGVAAAAEQPWPFSPALRAAAERSDRRGLRAYLCEPPAGRRAIAASVAPH